MFLDMITHMVPIYTMFCLLVGIKLSLHVVGRARMRRNLPPGPRGLPGLGNIFELPSECQWLRYTEWKAQYGPIMSLNLASKTVVVLNDIKPAADLLDRRSQLYSDRPRLIVCGELATRGMMFTAARYGDVWRRMRSATHECFNSRASRRFRGIQETEAALLVSHLLRDPEHWNDHLKRSAASIVLSAVYGWPPLSPSEDHVVKRINDFIHKLARTCVPGAYLVDIFPVMLYLPSWIAPWKRKALQWFKEDSEMFLGLLNEAQQKLRDGGSQQTFSAFLIENEEKTCLSKEEAAWLAGAMFAAGAETTSATLAVFMLAMTLYPDVMRRAQGEIDNVVGRDRKPTFEDEDHLPYITAIVKEVLRWRPVAPLGLPRRCMQDDWYNGYFIPKDALVFENIWAINHDSTYFPEPDEFRPERYLDSNGVLAEPLHDTHHHGHLSFGSGRRICIGQYFASQSLFIAIATILWAVNIEQTLDSDGRPIIPSRTDTVDDGVVVHPAPFKCSIRPRG